MFGAVPLQLSLSKWSKSSKTSHPSSLVSLQHFRVFYPRTFLRINTCCISSSVHLSTCFYRTSSLLKGKPPHDHGRPLVRFVYSCRDCMTTTSSVGGRPYFPCIGLNLRFLISIKGKAWKMIAMSNWTTHTNVAECGFHNIALPSRTCLSPSSCQSSFFLCLESVSDGLFFVGLPSSHAVVYTIDIFLRSVSGLACYGWIPSFFLVSCIQFT